MVKSIGRNINVADVAIVSSGIALNTSTSTIIAPINLTRIIFIFSNSSMISDVWIKLQSAATDDDKKGIFVTKQSIWTMPIDNIYTGEISAIAMVDSPEINYTEY